MVNSINMGWYILSKYYSLTDQSPVYVTALLLHPEKRRKYIDRHWQEEWRVPAMTTARQYWTRYRDRPIQIVQGMQTSRPQRQLTEYELLEQDMCVLEDDEEDEFERFVNAKPQKMSTKTPLEWWTREQQRIDYPRLYQMALDILSVPAMSDDPERVFSGARRTISWDRARLSPHSVEMLECLNSWVQNDLIRKLYLVVEGEEIEVSGDEGNTLYV